MTPWLWVATTCALVALIGLGVMAHGLSRQWREIVGEGERGW